ncbi:MAG: hypothetical protein QF521_22005 [Alphaproteobacteria bacterium]|nr:hypothetical protein [Alphaproteobacteria bacterium]
MDAINTLTAKRDELAAELKTTKARLAWLEDSLAHVDAALRLVDSTQGPLQVTQTNNAVRLFRKGYLFRFILSTLRARGPMDREAMTLAVMLDAGLDLNDKLLRSEVSRRVRYALRDQARNGRITRQQEPGQYMLWAIER